MAENTLKVLLFSGKAEHGKTTAALITSELLQAKGYRVLQLSYGQYVKDTAKMLFQWDGKKDEKGRALLQWWGTDKVRKKNENFWTESVKRLVDLVRDDFDFIILDDVRYENEITCWYGFNVTPIPIRIFRPGHISSLSYEQLSHISETALDDWDFKIKLDARDMAELEEAIRVKLMPELIPEDTLK